MCLHRKAALVGKRFYPPPTRHVNGRFSEDQVERLLWGVTVLTYRCERCGRLVTDQIAGEVPVDGKEDA